jgi:hypothetical protein
MPGIYHQKPTAFTSDTTGTEACPVKSDEDVGLKRPDLQKHAGVGRASSARYLAFQTGQVLLDPYYLL